MRHEETMGKTPPSIIPKNKPKVLIFSGLGCFIPLGIFVLASLSPVAALRSGLALLFTGIVVSAVGFFQYREARKDSLICPYCQKRVYREKNGENQSVHFALMISPKKTM